MAAVYVSMHHDVQAVRKAHTPNVAASLLNDRSTIPDYVLLFTIVMGSAFIGELFPQHVAELLRRNHLAKHLMALALLVLTVVWVRTDMSMSALLSYTVITYAWYFALTKMRAGEFLAVATLLFVVFASSHMTSFGPDKPPASQNSPPSALDDDDDDAATASSSDDGKISNPKPAWQFWLEFGALTGAAGLTAFFSAKHVLTQLMTRH